MAQSKEVKNFKQKVKYYEDKLSSMYFDIGERLPNRANITDKNLKQQKQRLERFLNTKPPAFKTSRGMRKPEGITSFKELSRKISEKSQLKELAKFKEETYKIAEEQLNTPSKYLVLSDNEFSLINYKKYHKVGSRQKAYVRDNLLSERMLHGLGFDSVLKGLSSAQINALYGAGYFPERGAANTQEIYEAVDHLNKGLALLGMRPPKTQEQMIQREIYRRVTLYDTEGVLSESDKRAAAKRHAKIVLELPPTPTETA